MKYLVRTPASVANLGPGFDCLGLALDLWNEMEAEAGGDHLKISIEGEGCDTLQRDESNLIYRSMTSFALRKGRTLPSGIRLVCHNFIPLSSGLGSSSAAILAGILTAASLLELPEDKADQLECAAEIEGHPDNVAPCLWGGFTISMLDQGRVFTRAFTVHDFTLVIVTPEFRFPTALARATLPEQVPHRDAVFNVSRVALLSEALQSGNLDLLARTTDDRLHQPYRMPLIPGAVEAISAARKAGAITVVLAGAGPSLMAFIQEKDQTQQVGDSMMAAFREAGLSARLFTPRISNEGASIKHE
jgi:homoserine kinase